MTSRSASTRALFLVLVRLSLLFPAVALAGHSAEDSIDTIPAERLKLLMDAGESIVLVDLRPAQEFRRDRLPGARSIPLTEFARRFKEVPQTGRVVLYCACELFQVAERALLLEAQGYKNVFVMAEGYPGWLKRGYPLETTQK
jgi:rhodanese-related sulfurtransferase